MNEIIPPSEPGKELPKPFPTRDYSGNEPPSKKLCAFLGFLLFLFSGGLAFVVPPLCFLGFAAAVASLFFEGYRCIFLGYILTLGFILLTVILYCAANPIRF